MWLGNEETGMRNVQITKTGGGFIAVSCIVIFYLSYKYSSGIWHNDAVDMQQLLAVSAQLAKLAGDRAWSIHKEQNTNLEARVKGKTKEGADEMLRSLVGSEMCIRDSCNTVVNYSRFIVS